MSSNSNLDIWIAGAFAAFAVDLIVFPLDTIKTRIQSPDYRKLYTHTSGNTVNKAALFRGLYQGLGSIIVTTLPASGAFFTTYEGTKAIFTRYNPSFSARDGESAGGIIPTPVIYSAASGVAELVSCAILTPAEVIKQNAQMVDTSVKSGEKVTTESVSLQTFRRFKSNPLALWRGYGALAGRNLPNTALQFPLFERFKTALKERRARSTQKSAEELSLLEHGVITGLAAGSAGCISAIITTPIDVVKTRIMLAAGSTFADSSTSSSSSSPPSGAGVASSSSSPSGAGAATTERLRDAAKDALEAAKRGRLHAGSKVQKSSIAIAREIVADSGWRGLWRGGALRGVWTMLGAGLYLGVYETGRVYLGERGRHDK